MDRQSFLDWLFSDPGRAAIAGALGGVTNLRGRRWTVLSGDYEVRADRYPAPMQPGANYDTRFPKISVNASGVVDVAYTLAEAYSGGLTAMIVNRQDATDASYALAEPAWVAALLASLPAPEPIPDPEPPPGPEPSPEPGPTPAPHDQPDHAIPK